MHERKIHLTWCDLEGPVYTSFFVSSITPFVDIYMVTLGMLFTVGFLIFHF